MQENEMAEFAVKSEFPVKSAHVVPFNDDRKIEFPMNNEIVDRLIRKETERLEEQFVERLKASRDESYRNGLQDGIKQTETKYFNQLSKSFQYLKKVADSLRSEMDALMEREEQNLLSLSLAIARKVIDAELTLNDEVVLSVLRNSMNLLGSQRSVRVLVNPQDWALVKENVGTLDLKVEMPKDIEVVSAPHIAPGGCVVEGDSGSVDADIETQFAEIRRKLLKDER